jgi:hypothetical protein
MLAVLTQRQRSPFFWQKDRARKFDTDSHGPATVAGLLVCFGHASRTLPALRDASDLAQFLEGTIFQNGMGCVSRPLPQQLRD